LERVLARIGPVRYYLFRREQPLRSRREHIVAKGTEIAQLAIDEAMEAAKLWKTSAESWKMIATERSSYLEAATYRAHKAEKRVAELEAMVDGYEKTFVAQEDEIRKLANGIAKRDETIDILTEKLDDAGEKILSKDRTIKTIRDEHARKKATIENYADQICRLLNELHDAREAARA